MARQNFIGLVVSLGKMDKTVKVRVQRAAYNRIVNKDMIKRKDYLVHDEGNICREGDLVRIEATRPLSARKFFAVAEIKRNKGSEFATYEEEAKVAVHEEEIQKHQEFLDRRTLSQAPSMIEELYRIEKMAFSTLEDKFSEQEIAEIDQLKKKYGITTWPPQEKLFDLGVEKLEKDLKQLLVKIDPEWLVRSVMEDESKLTVVLSQIGKSDITKKSIQKNLVRKFVNSTPAETLQSLGLYQI